MIRLAISNEARAALLNLLGVPLKTTIKDIVDFYRQQVDDLNN